MPTTEGATKTTLADLMLAKLEESDLDQKDAKTLGYKPLDSKEVAGALGHKRYGRGGFQLPYYDLHGKKTDFARIRYLEEQKPGAFGAKKKSQKYTQPSGYAPRFYLPPIGCSWAEVAKDIELSIIFTEGELKAACACKHGFNAIGLGGVWSWRSRREGKPAIDDFDAFNWLEREVYLIFDSDLRLNYKVKQALGALAQELTRRGAFVFIGYLPDVYPEPEDPKQERQKTGLDDFIVHRGSRELEEDVMPNAEPYELSKELWQLNEEVAVITDPGVVVNLESGQIVTASDFKNLLFANRRYKVYDSNGGLQEKSTAAEWIRWNYRTELRRLAYLPGKPKVHDKQYNLWTGWGCEPKKGTIAPWKKLLDLVFSGEDGAEARVWFERWCASLFQNPGVKPYSSVLIWGIREGTGKSIIGKTLGKIMGDNFAEIGNADFHSPYNDWAISKQLVLLDEVASAERRERTGDTELLKKLITQDTLRINPKYGKKFQLEDCIAFYMTSNNPDAIRLSGVGGNRRFFVWHTERKESQEFYDNYVEWMKGEGPSYLFRHLLDLKLGDFNPAGDAFETEAKREMGMASRSHLQHWLAELKESPDEKLGFPEGECSDLYTANQILALYESEGLAQVGIPTLSRELVRMGFERFEVKIAPGNGQSRRTYRLYAVRNADKWARARLASLQKHYMSFCFSEVSKGASKKPKF